MRFCGCTSSSRQSGVALVLLMLLLLVATGGYFISELSSARLAVEDNKQTTDALALAKQALIGRAASSPLIAIGSPGPGSLPCPDFDNDGSADPPCGTKDVSVLGKLPWRTLDLPDLRDGYGECLWYAVSGSFKNNPNTDVLNSNTNGQFEIVADDGVTRLVGSTASTRAAAVIFSAGPILSGQDRSPAGSGRCGGNNTASNYLDVHASSGVNNSVLNPAAMGTTTFSGGNTSGSFNDQLLPIFPDEIFSVTDKRVAKEVEAALNDYYTFYNFLPHAALFSDPTCLGSGDLLPPSCMSAPGAYQGRIPTSFVAFAWPVGSILRGDASTSWFQRNGWRELVYYAVAQPCTEADPPKHFCNGPTGSFLTLENPPATPSFNQKFVVVMSGRSLSGQARADPPAPDKTIPSNYVEGENLDLDDVYIRRAITSVFKDWPVSVTR